MAIKNQNDFGYNVTSGGYSDYITPDAWGNLDGYQKNWLSSSPEQQGLYANTSSNWTGDQSQSFMDMQNDAYTNSLNNTGLGFNTGTLEGTGAVLGGIGSLASAWAGLQGVKLGEKSLDQQNKQYGVSHEAQRTTTNNRIADQNAWKVAQGRTDLGAKVKAYNT